MTNETPMADLKQRWRTAIRSCDPLCVGGRVVSARA